MQRKLLTQHNRIRVLTRGDGNCMFHSVGSALDLSHTAVRAAAIAELQSNRHFYESFCPTSWGSYISQMSKDGEWGDHLCLQALANVYSTCITIFSDHATNAVLKINPETSVGLHPAIVILFWAEKHYEATADMSTPMRQNHVKVDVGFHG